MNGSEDKRLRLLMEFFIIVFFFSLAVTWYTMIVKKDFVVFTDPETVPEQTDFFAALFQ